MGYILMSDEELEYEITKVLERFSDDALKELLSFLKEFESKNSEAQVKTSFLKKILSGYKDLLQKLAQ